MSQIPNGIGQFIIGESSIGDQPFYWPDTLYSQYYNDPVTTTWLDLFSQAVDANESVDGFYDNVWNVLTAEGWGLDVWGIIVGLNTGRVIPASPAEYLGFEEADNINGNSFGSAIWYSGGAISENVTLSDPAFLLMILAKAASNTWDGSTPGLNKILRTLFPGQVAYATDGLDMTMTYSFGFALTPVQISIVFNTNVLPRPAGVSVTIVQF